MSQPSLDPSRLADKYVEEVRLALATANQTPRVVGLIASDDQPSLAYAGVTKRKFTDIGIEYDLRQVERLKLESEIHRANEDPDVDGIFIYFPVFGNQQDDYLRNQVDYKKDIEAGSHFWVRKLYANDRWVDDDLNKKALLPCTPLAILKLLTELGVYNTDAARPIEGKTVTIFNRSEVIGRPLAVMMSNDGGLVYSFDVHGALAFRKAEPSEINITREEALAESDIVITGVPDTRFQKVSASEIKTGAVCVNFASIPNFEDDINTQASIYLPRVGPMTVAMCMRNTLRLYENFHHDKPS